MGIDWNQLVRDLLIWLVPAGAVVTIAKFILDYAPALRNKITREFVVRLDRTGGSLTNGEFVSIDVSILMRARNSEPIKILDLYFKYSSSVDGLNRHGYPIKGRYDLDFWDEQSRGVFSHSRYVHFTFRNANGFLPKFRDRQISDLTVVVETNKYGLTESAVYDVSSLFESSLDHN